MRELCEAAKKGECCIDSICRGADVTLCGFDKELFDDITRDWDEREECFPDDEEELP